LLRYFSVIVLSSFFLFAHIISFAASKGTDKAFVFVGDTAMAENMTDGSIGKTVLHAVAGGTASVAMGGDFATGAWVGGIREVTSPLSSDMSDKGQLLVSSITGILVGKAAGGDRGADIGNSIATSAELNNGSCIRGR